MKLIKRNCPDKTSFLHPKQVPRVVMERIFANRKKSEVGYSKSQIFLSNIKYQEISINFDFFVAFLEVEFLRDFEYSKIEHIIERIVAFYTFQKNFSKRIIFIASKVDF